MLGGQVGMEAREGGASGLGLHKGLAAVAVVEVVVVGAAASAAGPLEGVQQPAKMPQRLCSGLSRQQAAALLGHPPGQSQSPVNPGCRVSG